MLLACSNFSPPRASLAPAALHHDAGDACREPHKCVFFPALTHFLPSHASRPQLYTTTLGTLCREPNSVLARTLAYRDWSHGQKPGESIFFDRDGERFRHVLNYLRNGTVPRNEALRARWRGGCIRDLA